jgi:LPXTG-motif cell wall-anchored protein
MILKSLLVSMFLGLGVTALVAGNGNDQGQNNNDQGRGAKGAPGPLVGAGLPALLIGGGLYWIVRRRKRAS